MTRGPFPRLVLVTLLLLVGAGLRPASLAVETAAPDGRPVLHRGDRGYALTALTGDAIERIPLEYIGTLDDFAGPGRDLYLIRLEGPVAENIGVAAGMSGSPVYVGDRLIGALSYRIGALPRQAIAGVTPIGDVLEAGRVAGSSPTDPTTRRIRTPLVASGLHPSVREWLAPQVEAYDLVLSSGAGAADADESDAPFAPGSPIGVGLVRGDLTLAATGTVTWVDGDRVYAFGHPFLAAGRTELPMHTARVIHTLADMLGPQKIAQIGGEVGAIVDDRLTAIVGRRGVRAAMIPVSLRVRGGEYGEQQFGFEVVQNRGLTGLLVGTSVANALVGNIGFDQRATMIVRGRIVFRGLPELPIDLAASGESASRHAFVVAGRLLAVIATLTGRYSDVALERIDLEVETRSELRSYTLDSLVYDRGPVAPGATVDIGCVLRDQDGVTSVHTIPLRIPRETSADSFVLAVGDPEAVQVALGRPIERRLRTATDPATAVRALSEMRSAHRLTAALYERSQGVVAHGESLEALPPTARRLLSNVPRGMRGGAEVAAYAESVLDGPVTGRSILRVEIEHGRDEIKEETR